MTISHTVTDPAATISRTLDDHGVSAIAGPTFSGPTVTQYAFSLSSGTPLKKVTALSKDIALALGLDEVRIVAPIPGTSYVGIEVPSAERETVTYGDFTEDSTRGIGYQEIERALPFPVGVDVTNEPIWADLAKLPHLLIAGATGSGKSVALSTLITSLIDHRGPADLRLWLIDPKRVELGQFTDAPQVEQVATSNEDAADVLHDVVNIMDHRYRLFEEAGVRNITEWNGALDAGSAVHLPYQVLVVDELADLMMTGGKSIEAKIVRIAQLGRAAGVHLVLATQRPTKDVVTGLISANVPSRWAFSVRSTVDSMVALDQPGANALYGGGDSLWLPAGSDKPVRVQGVFTDDQTIERTIAGAKNIYDPELTAVTTRSPEAMEDDDDDLDLADLGVETIDTQFGRVTPIEPSGCDCGNCDRVTPVPFRVRDRSEHWLDTPTVLKVTEPAETDQEWAEATVGAAGLAEGKLLQHIKELQDRVNELEQPKARPARWHRAHPIAASIAVGFGGLLTIGWVANIVEAVAR